MGFLEVTERSKVCLSPESSAFLLRKGSLQEFWPRVSSYTQFALRERKIETPFKQVTQVRCEDWRKLL